MLVQCDVHGMADPWPAFEVDLEIMPDPSALWSVVHAHAAFVGAEGTSPEDAPDCPIADKSHCLLLDGKETQAAAAAIPLEAVAAEYVDFGDDNTNADPLSAERIAEIRASVSIGTVQADTGTQLILPAAVLNVLPSPAPKELPHIAHLPFVELMLHGPGINAARRALRAATAPLVAGSSVSFVLNTESLLRGTVVEALSDSATLLAEDGSIVNLSVYAVVHCISRQATAALLHAYSAWRVHSRRAAIVLKPLSVRLSSKLQPYFTPASGIEPRSLWDVLGCGNHGNAGEPSASLSHCVVAVLDAAMVALIDLAQDSNELQNELKACVGKEGASGCSSSVKQVIDLLHDTVQGETQPSPEQLEALLQDAGAAILLRGASSLADTQP
jgi:hypothetical protein